MPRRQNLNKLAMPPNMEGWYDINSESVIKNSPSDDKHSDICIGEHEDSSCRSYRAHFLQSEHFNFYRRDERVGPLVLSLKYCNHNDSQSYHIRIILRLSTGTIHKLVLWDMHRGESSPAGLAKTLCPDLSITFLQPVFCPNTAELLLNFDE
jgi:hypothetical protein